jgi:outer membrane protein OmpA-like peptidoglycan-associated protein
MTRKLTRKLTIFLAALAALALTPTWSSAQDQDQQQQNQQGAPVISINVSRSIASVNYQSKGSTKIDFRGTALMPQAGGEAKIQNKNGSIIVNASFEHLSPATQMGSPYLTYVLWAITPEGRANNLGEVVVEGTKGKLVATTALQAFGMIVTAEPYYTVTVPSEDVVIENIVRSDTKGQVNTVDAKFELLQRGRYKEANYPPLAVSGDVPLELLEARNAKLIAQSDNADRYAPESWSKAMESMNRAEDYYARKQRKPLVSAAKDATQAFEDAITITVKRKQDERLAQQREAAAKRVADAKAAQEAEAQARAEADRQRMQSELQSAKDAQARAEAEAQQAQAQAAAQAAQAQAEQSRQSADQARLAAQQAEQEKEQLRADLLKQFNAILETRDTVRGLVVNLGDVLFAFGKYDLKPEARERLAKLSGIVLAHPGLNLSVEGYTDNVGSEEFNQKLSEQRAGTVRQYLIDQGLNPGSVTSQGFGLNNPVADNSTAAGRQKNRRVEIVISGEIIGTKIGATSTGGQQQPPPQQQQTQPQQ